MKIIDKREKRTTTFGKLLSGDVFRDSRGGHYIKVGLNDCNAINLYNGIGFDFTNGAEVLKENATLVIGGEEDDD